MPSSGSNRSNAVNTKEVKIRTTPAVVADLERLVKTGYWGKSTAEAAEAVLKEGLRQILKEERELVERSS
ncbi:MAG TPA: hypothetical protein VF017_04295 [Thermoanaerobaculia bacterium]|nr:hypothetical protein [Thermoanaerobaculia bacterium]